MRAGLVLGHALAEVSVRASEEELVKLSLMRYEPAPKQALRLNSASAKEAKQHFPAHLERFSDLRMAKGGVVVIRCPRLRIAGPNSIQTERLDADILSSVLRRLATGSYARATPNNSAQPAQIHSRI